MKNLVYANSPGRARLVLRWVEFLSGRLPLDITVQRVMNGNAPKEAAARLLVEEIASMETVRSAVTKERKGAPEEIIAAEVRESDYDLVTLAPAGRQGFNKLLRGSMVAHVVQRVSTSVLVVREGGHVPPRRVLACVSGARHSLTTATLAAQVARLAEARLTLLLVLSQLGIGLAGGEPWETDPSSFLDSEDPLARNLRVASEVATKVGVAPEVKVRQGLVSAEILRQIREGRHDLLVMGTHRAEGFDTVYEDLTDEVVRRSAVSTLVVGMRAGLL